MNKSGNSIYIKLCMVIALCVIIASGLLYLVLTGRSDRLVADAVQPEVVEPLPEEPVSEQDPVPVPKPEPSPEPLPALIDTTSDASLYRIADYSHPIDPHYVPDSLALVTVPCQNKIYLRSEVIRPLQEMFQSASKDGISLYLISGYRSYASQTYLWNYYCEKYGEERAKQIDCYPGVSEHMLGLALDIGTVDRQYELDPDFANTSAFAWLKENAWQYGFILRYPEGKENITGIQFSPWSFRYVGTEEASKIHKEGVTMEEYYATTR